ncbi:hypothetical protein [Myxosarcina sp. GI1]|uniref:hypothetical protein n=1 Tax=Myxosarcina sp. GI1 TaxID=1541065 RepID=UPI000564E31E|nr:hypothetical protein [Myxosarcina sp. GI1]
MFKNNLLIKLGASTLVLSLASVFGTIIPTSLQAQETDSSTTIEDIEENPTAALGEEVTVRGQVEEVEPDMSFTINEEGFLEGDDVLVLNVSGEMLPEMPDEQLELQVTGELGEFVYADVNRLYGLDLDPDIYVDYENRPVIFAEALTLSPGIGDISDRPENFYGKEVAVEGEVGQIWSDTTFRLDEIQLIAGEDLLVVNLTGESIPSEEENIVVTGTVRPFVSAEFERDYDLTWDLDVQEQLEAEYSQKPVLVVDSIN